MLLAESGNRSSIAAHLPLLRALTAFGRFLLVATGNNRPILLKKVGPDFHGRKVRA
jgi:hypothetical protein